MTAPPPPPVRPPSPGVGWTSERLTRARPIPASRRSTHPRRGFKWHWTTGLLALGVVAVIVSGVFAWRSLGRISGDINTAKVGDCVEPYWPHTPVTWHLAECTGSGDSIVTGRIDSQMRPADDATLQELCRGFSPTAG